MSSAKSTHYAISFLLMAGLTACASQSTGPALTDEEKAVQAALEAALKPAGDEEIARAERSDPLTRANFWGDEYRKDPQNLETTLYFLNALRTLGSHDRITEVITQSLPLHPDSHDLFLEMGRALLALNRAQEASQAFLRATDLAPETEAAPLAGLGLTFDRLGYHDKAQEAYQIALERAPQRISTLNNYGLSLALTGHIDTAETVLRYAESLPGANARVRQNLALVLGLQGKYNEMERIDPNAPRRTIEANRKALERMMMPERSLENLQAYSADITKPASPEVQKMPELRHATVEEEGLAEPGTLSSPPPAQTQPVRSSPLRLKPRLRETQGG